MIYNYQFEISIPDFSFSSHHKINSNQTEIFRFSYLIFRIDRTDIPVTLEK